MGEYKLTVGVPDDEKNHEKVLYPSTQTDVGNLILQALRMCDDNEDVKSLVIHVDFVWKDS